MVSQKVSSLAYSYQDADVLLVTNDKVLFRVHSYHLKNSRRTRESKLYLHITIFRQLSSLCDFYGRGLMSERLYDCLPNLIPTAPFEVFAIASQNGDIGLAKEAIEGLHAMENVKRLWLSSMTLETTTQAPLPYMMGLLQSMKFAKGDFPCADYTAYCRMSVHDGLASACQKSSGTYRYAAYDDIRIGPLTRQKFWEQVASSFTPMTWLFLYSAVLYISRTTSMSRRAISHSNAHEVSEGVGAIVRRSIGSGTLLNLTPFLMLDHFKAKAGEGGAFPDHPHRGQTTVSYMINGIMKHEDFLGNTGTLDKGDVQWMTAGKGIMHSEVPYYDPDPSKALDVEGMQLWIDLPKDQKFCEPSYQERKAKDIPTITPADGVEITLISGDSHGTSGFVRPVGGCCYFGIKLSKPGASVFQALPKGWTSFLYLISGKVLVGEEATVHVKHHTLVLSAKGDEDGVLLRRPERADDGEVTHLVLIAGEPLDQPVVQYGPFVLNAEKQAREAFMDFRTGRNGFEKAPGWESVIGKGLAR